MSRRPTEDSDTVQVKLRSRLRQTTGLQLSKAGPRTERREDQAEPPILGFSLFGSHNPIKSTCGL